MERDSFLDKKFHVIVDTCTLLRLFPINALFALGLAFKVHVPCRKDVKTRLQSFYMCASAVAHNSNQLRMDFILMLLEVLHKITRVRFHHDVWRFVYAPSLVYQIR
jgi:hypothetical protein